MQYIEPEMTPEEISSITEMFYNSNRRHSYLGYLQS